MGYTVTLILSYSILPPFIVGVYKYAHLRERYLPLLLCLALGVANEITSTIVITAGHSNAFNCSIYYLLEALLLLIQFARWGLFDKNRTFYLIAVLLTIVWISEKHNLRQFHLFLPVFRITTAVLVIALSLRHIFRLMVFNRSLLRREPSFLLCFGFCTYFLCVILTEVFIGSISPFSGVFQDLLFRTSIVCNVIANAIYLKAILWIPMKQSFFSASLE